MTCLMQVRWLLESLVVQQMQIIKQSIEYLAKERLKKDFDENIK